MNIVQRAIDKRGQIVAAGRQLFSRFGAKRVSVGEICQEAAVSKATFYKHFANKVALLRQLHDDIVEEGFAKFDEISALDLTFPEKIERMGLWKAEFASKLDPQFFGDLIDVDHTVEEHKRRYLANVEAGRRTGDVRSDIDLEFLWLVLEKLGELYGEPGWKEIFSDAGEFQRQLRALIWHGLLTRPGG